MTTPAHIPAPCGCCTYVVSGDLARLLPADCLRPCPTGADPGVQYAPLSLVLDALTPAPALSDCLALAQLVLQLGTVDRATQHPDGRPESDTTHTCMLGLLGAALAPHAGVQLDAGLVAQFALVHDLPEARAGDTNTARALSPEAAEAMRLREIAATAEIAAELPGLPWVVTMLERYEAQVEPEARYVRYLDKILVRLTHAGNGCRAPKAMGMSLAELQQRNLSQGLELAARYPELSSLHQLWDEACAAAEAAYGMAEPLPATIYLDPHSGRHYLVRSTLVGAAAVHGVVITPWSERLSRRRRGEGAWSAGQVPGAWRMVRELPLVEMTP